MRIAKKVLKKAKQNQIIIMRLVSTTGRTYSTIMRWLNNNDEMLTTADCLLIFCEELQLSQDEVLENVKVKA